MTDPKSAPNCFEIYSDDGVIKAWKKDSDGKPVPGVWVCGPGGGGGGMCRCACVWGGMLVQIMVPSVL